VTGTTNRPRKEKARPLQARNTKRSKSWEGEKKIGKPQPILTTLIGAPSPYRLTRVVHDLRSGAFRRLPHRQRQIVNNSAATKTLSVDKSARLIFFQPEDTHRPATNMHRKQSLDYFNQSFGRARCAPVRQTNSHLPTRFQRLDYKAFAEREQCVLPIKRRSTQHKKKENSNDSKPILRSLHWPG